MRDCFISAGCRLPMPMRLRVAGRNVIHNYEMSNIILFHDIL
jgi:hypothetical protein